MARMLLSVPINPFLGIAESEVTSAVVDTRDAFDLTLSYRTSSGTSSVLTYQVSNSTEPIIGGAGIPEASWSNYTTLLGAERNYEPPLGYRYARMLRTASLASWTVEMNKMVR